MEQSSEVAYAQLIHALGLPANASEVDVRQQIKDRHPDILKPIIQAEQLSDNQKDINSERQ